MARLDTWLERLGNRWFFYGWLIVFSSFTSSMINAGTGSYALGFFIIPMGEEIGISRTQFSVIPIFKLATIPILPLLGLLVDRRHGGRIIVSVGSLVGGTALAFTSQIDKVWQFYMLYGIIYGFGTAAMGSQLVGPSLMAKWFVRMRGRAMAIGTMGISAGGVVVAPVAGLAISTLGWRAAWVVLGMMAVVAIVPVSSLFLRRSPEDIGLLPDGNASELNAEVAADNEVNSWTLNQSIRDTQFWILLLIQCLGLSGLVVVLFHEVAYIQDKGLNIQSATLIATSLATSAMISKLPFGYLAEKMDIRRVLALCLIPAGLSTYMIIPLDSVWILVIWGAIHGFFMGGFPTLTNVALPEYFGRQYMGSIRGVIAPITMIISALSPLIAGILWEESYSYSVAFFLFGSAWVIGGLLTFTLSKPKNPPAVKNITDQKMPV
ncbi:MAG: MFS transporter [SAR202 cluster bacterium]|jgi:MFS family permease|nr:MFS transporter [SAR202 cluster bacterium]|tara:strand:+ start:13403 stop:14707 length:1305 start_codon:yes stop_codon:yes gene_type:complete